MAGTLSTIQVIGVGEVDVWLAGVLTAISLFLALISYIGYVKREDRTLLLLFAVFIFIGIRSILISLSIFIYEMQDIYARYRLGMLIDFALLLLFLSLFLLGGGEREHER
ncbi:MAG: hypothetical protein DRN20_03095 [Thermoplasmata archaeon]|nr:MAG: hypothetical protein DRN20_03095 [Thermoplasmata archaeon]